MTPPASPAAGHRPRPGCLDWRRATVASPAPCVLCGKPALLRSPGKGVPCHKTCAETWQTSRAQQHNHEAA